MTYNIWTNTFYSCFVQIIFIFWENRVAIIRYSVIPILKDGAECYFKKCPAPNIFCDGFEKH